MADRAVMALAFIVCWKDALRGLRRGFGPVVRFPGGRARRLSVNRDGSETWALHLSDDWFREYAR